MDEKNLSPEIKAPSFWEALKFWFKLGWISFGGPAGQIAIMHQELVDKKKWIGEDRFLHALNYCMLLPGPEAQQLATYIGWILHKTRGAIVAGALFVLPASFLLFALSYVYITFGTLPWVASIFVGLKASVLAIVLAAVIKIGKKSLRNHLLVALAALSFVVIYFLKFPYPALLLSFAAVGVIGSHLLPHFFLPAKKSADPFVTVPIQSTSARAMLARSGKVIALFLALWLVPFFSLYFLLPDSVFVTEALFFTKAAFLTFGGAYSLLGYIAQAGVEHYGWLTSLQMIDGLGLAETTPGPLIMVVQFVGFIAGWGNPGGFSPLQGSVIGSVVATYFTFLPSFFFIFLGAPYVERLIGNKKVSAALSTITAAVVGVILNLGVWFGAQVLFLSGEFAWFSGVLAVLSFSLMHFLKVGIIPIVLGSGILGYLWLLFGF